jgi:hypothetical protein
VQLGGDPQAGLEVALGNFDKIKDFLIKGSLVSDVNVGVPISYKINHLADNTTAMLTNTLSYTFTSQEFRPDTPKNDVVIDIFNIKANVSSSRTISNHSSFAISELTIYYGSVDNVEAQSFKVINSTVNLPLYNGFDYPVFYAKVFPSLNPDYRIRIKCKIKMHHQTYGGSTHQDDQSYTLQQDFEYNKGANKWSPVVSTDREAKHMPFESMNYQWNAADMETNVSLYYRFYCDGRIYDYATDGRP